MYMNNDNTARPYINKGPQQLNMCMQRTACNLMLFCESKPNHVVGQEPTLRTLRGDIDIFPCDVNFGELPNLDSDDKQEQKMSHKGEAEYMDGENMIFDEQRQF